MFVEPTPGGAIRIALSIVAAIGTLTLIVLAPPPRPRYGMVDEVAMHPRDWDHEQIRVHGWVRAGSIQRAGRTTTFELTREGVRLAVSYVGLVPETLKDQSEVVVSGELVHDGDGWILGGTELMAKCATKYDAGSAGTTVYK